MNLAIIVSVKKKLGTKNFSTFSEKLELYGALTSNPGPPCKYKTYTMDKINDKWNLKIKQDKAHGKEAFPRPRASWLYF